MSPSYGILENPGPDSKKPRRSRAKNYGSGEKLNSRPWGYESREISRDALVRLRVMLDTLHGTWHVSQNMIFFCDLRRLTGWLFRPTRPENASGRVAGATGCLTWCERVRFAEMVTCRK